MSSYLPAASLHLEDEVDEGDAGPVREDVGVDAVAVVGQGGGGHVGGRPEHPVGEEVGQVRHGSLSREDVWDGIKQHGTSE